MQRIPVESSDVVSIGYDPKDRLLEVEFHGGRVYRYRDVEPDIHAQFMKAESHGQYLFAYINGRYRYEKVRDGAQGQNQGVVFVTGHPDKIKAFKAACEQYKLSIPLENAPLDELQSVDADMVAIKKAKQAYKLLGGPVLVSDSFWNIIALRGFPGAYMKDMNTWLHSEDFLRLLEGKTDRAICLTETVVYHDGQRTKVFKGDNFGVITTEPHGEGVSIRRIVIMNGTDKTMAELDAAGQSPELGVMATVWNDCAKWLHMQQRLGKL